MSTATVYFRRSDETVNRIIKAAFPFYTGTNIKALVAETVRFDGTNWDSGRRSSYVIVRLADMVAASVAESPYFRDSPLHTTDHAIPAGFVIVRHENVGLTEYMTIISPPANVAALLPAPTELSADEKTVLIATRSFKSSYGGVSNYRYAEAYRCTGITLERYEAAKAGLIGRKLLNKAGAITVEGRNAIGRENFPYIPTGWAVID